MNSVFDIYTKGSLYEYLQFSSRYFDLDLDKAFNLTLNTLKYYRRSKVGRKTKSESDLKEQLDLENK